MAFDRLGDLRRREHQTAGRVQNEIKWPVFVGEPDRPENVLGVVNVNITDHRNSQHVDAFLAMNQDDHPATAVFLQRPDGVFPQRFYSPALDDRNDKEQHDQESDKTAPRKDRLKKRFTLDTEHLLLHSSDK